MWDSYLYYYFAVFVCMTTIISYWGSEGSIYLTVYSSKLKLVRLSNWQTNIRILSIKEVGNVKERRMWKKCCEVHIKGGS